MPSRDLKFRYLGDAKSLTKASGKAERALGGVDQKSRKAGKGLGVMKGAAGKLGLVLGGAVLLGGAKKAVARAEEMNSAYAATEQILVATGGAANLTGTDLKKMAVETSLLTGIDKALIIEGQNILLTFKNVREEVGEGNDIFSRAQTVMLDFAAVLKTDAKSGAIQLGKALQDPIKGISALGRVGVIFTDVQREQIRNFQESGDIIGAQNIILSELEGQVGGVAAATADSTAKISNAWKEVSEEIGNILLPTIDALVPAFQDAAEKAAAIPGAVRNIGIAVETARRAFGGLTDVIDVALGPTINFTDAWTDQADMIFQVTRKIGDYQASLANGISESQAFQGTLLSMAAAGDIQIGTLKELINQTGISNDGLRDAILVMIRNQDEYGLTATMVADLKRELFGLDQQSKTTVGEGLEELAGGLGDVAGEGNDASAAIRGIDDTLAELADPVAKAIGANKRLEEVLERIQEDGILTQDEMAELGTAYGTMQAAADNIDADNIDAFQRQGSLALGLLDESTKVSGDVLEKLPFRAEKAFAQTEAAFLELIKSPLRIKIEATLPSKANFDAAVIDAITRGRRNRPGVFP